MQRQGRWAKEPDALSQHSTHQVIRAMTLESLDMNSKVIYRRCLPGGPWRRLLPGIILLHNNDPTPDQLVHAALLYAGSGAIVTGEEACRRHGLHLTVPATSERKIHVLIPHHLKRISSDFVTVERTKRMPACRCPACSADQGYDRLRPSGSGCQRHRAGDDRSSPTRRMHSAITRRRTGSRNQTRHGTSPSPPRRMGKRQICR